MLKNKNQISILPKMSYFCSFVYSTLKTIPNHETQIKKNQQGSNKDPKAAQEETQCTVLKGAALGTLKKKNEYSGDMLHTHEIINSKVLHITVPQLIF